MGQWGNSTLYLNHSTRAELDAKSYPRISHSIFSCPVRVCPPSAAAPFVPSAGQGAVCEQMCTRKILFYTRCRWPQCAGRPPFPLGGLFFRLTYIIAARGLVPSCTVAAPTGAGLQGRRIAQAVIQLDAYYACVGQTACHSRVMDQQVIKVAWGANP